MDQEPKNSEASVLAGREIGMADVESAFYTSGISLDRMMEVREFLKHSSTGRKMLAKILDDVKEKNGIDPSVAWKYGAGKWMLGRAREARDALAAIPPTPESAFFLGQAFLDLGQPGKAAEQVSIAAEKNSGKAVSAALISARIAAGDAAGARQALKKSPFDRSSSDYIVFDGRILDAEGMHFEAIDAFRKALEITPDHPDALFRLAYALDLHGDDEGAIRNYRKILDLPHPNVNALINLGVLYEDRGDTDGAIECYEKILVTYPNHPRALSFLKDALASLDEIVDEERDRLEDRRLQVLRIPISDFELSVRSRNCLAKMKIRTLGDLVRKSEMDMLGYKNFGETSLAEIKAILDSKGLALGMNIEELERRDRRRRVEALLQRGHIDDELRARPISDLGLSLRSYKCLEAIGIKTLGDLMSKTRDELMSCKNFGQTSLIEVKKKLAEFGAGLAGGDFDEELEEGELEEIDEEIEKEFEAQAPLESAEEEEEPEEEEPADEDLEEEPEDEVEDLQ